MLTSRLVLLTCGFETGAAFGFVDHRKIYAMLGLLAPDGIRLSQRGKRIFAQDLAGLIDKALN